MKATALLILRSHISYHRLYTGGSSADYRCARFAGCDNYDRRPLPPAAAAKI